MFSRRDDAIHLPAPSNDLTSVPSLPGSLSANAEALKASAGRQFLELDGRVLRFFATAERDAAAKNGDDTRSDGVPRAYAVHYFLADDTVEVLEVLPAGVEDYSKVLKRQRLPKPSALPGGGFGVGIRPASQDTIRRGGVAGRVDWRDLRVGGELNVFGKVLTLRDCDESTKQWYVSELGEDDAMFAPQPAPLPPARASRAAPPPHVSGIGSDADSLQYCLRLVPKAQPTKDFTSWAANSGQVLRFTATFVSDARREVDEIDKTRAFVVSYFLEDNTVSVYEPPVPNSGLPGGPFFKRQAARRSHASSEYLRARDCVVGAVVEISGRALRLNGADDATLALMEARLAEFPKSDFARVAADAAGAARGRAAPRATRCAAPPPRRTSSFSAAARWYSTGAPSSMCSPATVSVTASRWTRNRSSRCGAVCPKNARPKPDARAGRRAPRRRAGRRVRRRRGSVRAARRAVGGGNERRVSASKRVVCDESCMFI